MAICTQLPRGGLSDISRGASCPRPLLGATTYIVWALLLPCGKKRCPSRSQGAFPCCKGYCNM